LQGFVILAPQIKVILDSMKIINLALQGGGSHGAFTWGVLDALLEDGRIQFEGISGTSAGAMNAVAMAQGFAMAQGKKKADPRELARESLSTFWNGVADMGISNNPWSALWGGLWDGGRGGASPLMQLGQALSQVASPYQLNPTGMNPLEAMLERHVDFERLRKFEKLKVFVCATRVSTGKAEIFSGARLSSQAVMASACLPMMFQAVEIEGDLFWDGGYSGNPAIHPLIYKCASRDVLLVQINPIRRPMDEKNRPKSAQGIMERVNEVTFNASLLAEMRAIDFVKRLLHEGRLDMFKYKDVLMHRIDGGTPLSRYGSNSKLSTDRNFLKELFELGRKATADWLKGHYAYLGRQDTINIARDYLDDLRITGKTSPRTEKT
jgi:NTE family protein